MHRIFEQLFLLPIRSFLFGLGVMSETFRGLQKLGEESLGEIEGRPRDPTRAEGPKPTPAESLPAPASATIDPEVAETLFGRSEPSWSSTPRSPVLPGSSRLTEPMGFSGPETLAIRQPDPGGGPLPSEADPVPRTDPTENVSEEIYPIATKEEEKMYMDQDLSGDQVKVVQYSIVNVVPGIADNERIIAGPCLVAFSDDMTPEDFTAWIIAEKCPHYDPKPRHPDDCCPDAGGPYEYPCYPGKELEKCWDRKYLRVAFTVQGRFAKAAINWEELQALSVAKLVEGLHRSNQKIDHLVQNTKPPIKIEVENLEESKEKPKPSR